MIDLLYHDNNINMKERFNMSEELMKEICRSYHYGYTVEKIAEIEEVEVNDVNMLMAKLFDGLTLVSTIIDQNIQIWYYI